MGKLDNSEAFLRAFEASDCETLNVNIRSWFETPYRTPENVIDVAACVHSAIVASLTAREAECKAHWRDAEAQRWRQARQNFDAGMRGFLEAVGKAPKPEPYQGEACEQACAPKPSIGSGWHIPQVPTRRRGRPPKARPNPFAQGWGMSSNG